MDRENFQQNVVELKIITTRVCSEIRSEVSEGDGISFARGALLVHCGGGTALEVCLFLPVNLIMEFCHLPCIWVVLRAHCFCRYWSFVKSNEFSSLGTMAFCFLDVFGEILQKDDFVTFLS